MHAPGSFTARVLLAPALMPFAALGVQAQTYPKKAIRFIVPYPAGDGADIIARMIGAKPAEGWDQRVVVENRAGASGILGNDVVAKAVPDGYTVLIGISTLVRMPHLNPKLPYDVLRDFTPVAQLALSSNLSAWCARHRSGSTDAATSPWPACFSAARALPMVQARVVRRHVPRAPACAPCGADGPACPADTAAARTAGFHRIQMS